MEEIELSRWVSEGRLRQCKNVLPDGLNWLCYFEGNSKSHRDNSISFIFLESPHQVCRHEKCGQMLETLFWLLQCSKNPRWLATPKFVTVLLIDISELPHSIVIYLRKKKVLRKILFSYLSSGVK